MDLHLDFESSSASSDEEIVQIVAAIESEKVFRRRANPFEKYNENEFREKYRFNKTTIQTIATLIEHDIAPITLRNEPLSATDQLLITLRFYATGAFQNYIGDDYGVHKSTVCRIIQRVSEKLASLRSQFIQMPESHEGKDRIKVRFQSFGGFPNVLGCVNTTHISIISPGGDEAELFRNRNNYFSINVQVVCDGDLLIRDVDAQWPGSTSEETIWNESCFGRKCETGGFNGSYILGDCGYICTQYLLTPVLNPHTQAERNYNLAHKKTRSSVEKCFTVWKRRFPCLVLPLRTKIETTRTIIVATAILHNLAVRQNDFGEDFEECESIVERESQGTREVGHGTRTSLIDSFFK